jgi:superfamily II DNA or RNA helicase
MKAPDKAIALLVNDETHRVTESSQYCKVQEYFGCKWVGLTATPDRTDGQGLVGSMYDECWYDGRLPEFVEQGWLVPPRVQHIHVGSLQWRWLKGKSGKDFTSEQVQKVWQDFKAIHEFVAPIVKEVGSDKKTLYFCPGVPQAKEVAEVINSMTYPRRTADYVASYQIDEGNNRSDYPKDRRRLILRKFGDVHDELQHVANMGVLTEGTNVPIIGAIGWLRFTKSRLLLAQGCGRVFRTWPGILDGLERATARERREVIARSPKPFALIFDPTKRAGSKLKLAHVIDLFAPANATPALRKRIHELLVRSRESDGLIEPEAIVEEAERLESPFYKGLRAALLEIAPDITYRMTEVDPYGGGKSYSSGVRTTEPAQKNLGDASDKQKRLVKSLSGGRFADEFYMSLGRKQAGAVIDKLMKEPCQSWIVAKLKGTGFVPKNNKEGLAYLRQIKNQTPAGSMAP